ncbi:DUF2268 domain-containing putative Zn-dependent protease [Alkaliphilus transvaalensis]|uniref:DUF2268 domain-containing putative Zn-dependent protease n=1 Tax=Alkaliphilus transvaalensis TaxID=114628 RepID=UPI000479AFD6|nr:DUF2268 domain-containing putative Zn-dependent protease [Alkaliphilus transvaalensis]
MEVKFINTIESVKNYIKEIENGNLNYDELWDEFLIKPYWKELSQWAPYDCSFMKPSPIKDIEKLKEQLEVYQEINFNLLKTEFNKINNALVKEDDDPLVIAFYPLDDLNLTVKERQNGVVGTGIFGNIIININPLANDYEKWIPYVIAHEYHHSVWGHNWYVLRGNVRGTLLENIISEGQADAFAKSLYGQLEPQWLNKPLTEERENLYWEKYQQVLDSTDRSLHNGYLFGDESIGLPWCIGYYFGYEIVKSFLRNNPQLSFTELIDIEPDMILNNSRFYKTCPQTQSSKKGYL